MTPSGSSDDAAPTVKKPDSLAELVTSSRAGDRFHYVWAAVQSLKLLDQSSGLVQLWVEGSGGDPVAGDEIIDIAEYYGSALDRIDHVVVRQLKYSTKRVTLSMPLSELGPVLHKFAQVDSKRGAALRVPAGATTTYVITTNRPISARVQDAIKKIVDGDEFSPKSVAANLLTWLELDRDSAAELLRRVFFDGAGSELRWMRARLDSLTAELTGDTDATVPSVLIEQISRRASGELTGPIDLTAVAMAFGIMVEDLVPAPSLIPREPPGVIRDSYRALAESIITSETPLILSAVGGAGKTTFASSLPTLLGDRATVVVYDCFGNGSYRAPDKPRHRHRDGLVQIASELAARALCAPIIPRSSVAAPEMVKAFVKRLREARSTLAEKDPAAQLVIIVDAADNAALAADSRGDQTFVRDLLTLAPIEGVHIVLTARPYRVHLLAPPVGIQSVELAEFSINESARMLRSVYAPASDNDVAEFHRRTSANPRIQALALTESTSLRACLDSLGGLISNEGDAVEQLLGHQLDLVLEVAGSDRESLNFTGQLLATLRPRVPIDVLAALSGAEVGLIRSFVSDLGRGLLMDDEAVQFLDEPTESFFRARYQLSGENADRVIAELTKLSVSSAYAAASLPQVLWEAERYEDLTQLAVSENGLPRFGEVERRQISQLRTAFALRAAIRRRSPAATVEMAMIAGAAAASSERRYTLLRDQPDLAGEVLDGTTLDELRAARLFPSEWPGSALGAEAVMLAMKPERSVDALSRLRAADAAINAFSDAGKNGQGRLEPRHGANVALGIALLVDETRAARYLELWTPAGFAFEQAALFTSTLLSRGENSRVTKLGVASRTSVLSLALASEMQRRGLPLDPDHARIAWRTVRGARVDIAHDEYSLRGTSDATYGGIVWIATWAVRYGTATQRQAINLLKKYLPSSPPRGLGDARGRDNSGLLCAYALLAALRGKGLTVKELESATDGRYDPGAEGERAQLARILPWIQEWARWALGNATTASTLEILKDYPTTRSSYRDPILLRRLAGPMTAQFARSSTSTRVAKAFEQILRTADGHSGLYVATDMIACVNGDSRFADAVYACAASAAESAEREQQSADQMADDLVHIARSVFVFDRFEAHAYFGRAVSIASRVGEDAWQRWDAIVALAGGATVENETEAFLLASRVASVAENLEPYVYNGINIDATVRALHRVAGSRSLAILSQWRDRRFWDFGTLIDSARDDPAGIVASRPELGLALSTFSSSAHVAKELNAITETGELTAARFAAVQELVRARGEEINAEDVDQHTAAEFRLTARRTTTDPAYVSTSLHNPDYEAEQASLMEILRQGLRSAVLSNEIGMSAAALRIKEGPIGSHHLLTDEIRARPKNTWAAILRAFIASDSFSSWDRARFIQTVAQLPSESLAFRLALSATGEDYLQRHASDITTGYSHGFDIAALASVLQMTVPDTLMRALELTDAETALSSANSCYRLAGAIAPLLSAEESVRVLNSSLDALESALEIDQWTSSGIHVPTAVDPASATIALIWAALADPRASLRWRAIHALRFVIVYAIEDAIEALASVVSGGRVAGFDDERFPFYEMHAVEGFLVAAERAALEAPDRLIPLVNSVATVRAKYPDHVLIQAICNQIGTHCGNDSLVRDSSLVRADTEDVPHFKRPRAPSAMGHDGASSEYSFHFDLDEQWIAPLTESFSVEHQEVVNAMSDLVLDEWSYRGSPLLEKDPRRDAGAYESSETYFSKYESPPAEDFDYYLTHHALLTIAGRLLQTTIRYRDPDDGTDAYDEWFRQFDLAREDRRWISDARRPVPEHDDRHQTRGSEGWLWSVSPGDFVRAFSPDDDWVTVYSSAYQSAYRTSDNTAVRSALVSNETGGALVRALQTAPSFRTFRLPYIGEDDFAVDEGPFQLLAWIDSPESRQGADSRDDFARNIRFPTPRPGDWIVNLMGLIPTLDGLSWTLQEGGDVVAVSDAWSRKESGRESNGPEGTRLRVSRDLLTTVAVKADMSIILEVRIDRRDDSRRNYSHDDDTMGYIDDYVQLFSFTPGEGWRDYRGRSVARTAHS